jgi:hypothetical protein
VFLPESALDFGNIRSAFSIALHMHQPLIPAGGTDLHTAAVISNLKYMMDHPGIGDNHNAPVFHWCYKRLGEFIPQLVHEGKNPRVMFDYSGCLLHGLRAMGLNDVFDSLNNITCPTGAVWSGWVRHGATQLRPPRRCKIFVSMFGRGSITSQRSLASRR